MSIILLDRAGLDPVLKDWISGLMTPPSPALAKDLNNLLKGLRADGNLTELDLFHTIGGLETDEQRLRPLITTSTTKTFTAVNSPTLDSTGITGDGATSYLNTNWAFSTNNIKYTLNSASIFQYCRTVGAASAVRADMGATNGGTYAYMETRYSGNLYYTAVNDGGGSNTANASAQGFFHSQRTSSSNIDQNKNGTLLNAAVKNSTTMNASTLFICSLNNASTPINHTPYNYALFGVGSGNINRLTFYNRIQTYMTSRGIAV